MNGSGRHGHRRSTAASRPPRLHVRTRRTAAAQAGRHTAHGRLAWLDRASTAIGTTLDLRRTAQEMADAAVPHLADGCAVDLLESVLLGEEGARWKGVAPLTRAVAVSSVERLAGLEPDPVGEFSARPGSVVAVHCLTAREPVLLARMRPEDYDRVAPGPRAAAKMRAAGVHSYMAVPMAARGVLLGVADFVRARGRPPFSRADLELARRFALRAALLVDNARLYERERERVVSLQRSLLPRATPHTPGLEVSARYTPSTDPGGVGGDWFDVVALPTGRTALVVGDVMGHGLPAAATMGRLRTVARTLLSLDTAPERVLARLDLAARDLEDDQAATCLCAVYDPAAERYTLAAAGHMPPLLVAADGSASYAEVPVGAPLGTGVIPYDAVELPAPPGSRLVLYTDGLVKTRREDVDTQLERFRRAAADAPAPPGPAALVEALTGGCADDRSDESVLLVAAGRRPAPEADLRVWELPAGGTAAAAARRLVTGQLARWGLGELADVSELVVSELVGNALRYGGAPGGCACCGTSG